jgi:hypothetical protein
MSLNSITRALYGPPGLSNNLRVAGRVLRGHPETLAKHIRNKALFRAFGRFLR